MSVHRGEAPCTVTTATSLDEATLTELKTVLKSFLSKGQVLKLEVKTDPSIMGEMIVRIGEKYVECLQNPRFRSWAEQCGRVSKSWFSVSENS